MYLTFAHPKYLFLLFAIPLIILVHLLTLKNRKERALKFANFEAIARVKGVEFFSKNIITSIFSIIVIFLLVMAISGLTLHKQANASSFSFILAIDTSRSMEAQDMIPNRLEAAKETAKNFVEVAPPNTGIGIVSFSGNAYINKDVTKEKDELQEAINSIEQSSIEGTDMYEVIITSTNLLKNEEGRAIILLSDGQLNVGEIEDTISYANDNNVIVHAIAIGTEEGGKTSYGISKTDIDSLKALAYHTSGEFSEAQNKEALSESLVKMLKLTSKTVSIELSTYLLFASIFFFVAEYILISLRYRLLP